MSSAVSRRVESCFATETGAAKRVVISGSISFMHQMRQIKTELDNRSVKAIMPDDIDGVFDIPGLDAYKRFKRGASVAHLNKIRDPRTYAVLVANFDKNGVRGYLGANSFAEVSVAFAARKRIFLLGEIPSQYADELSAWGAIALNGDLSELIRMYDRSCRHATAQLRFPQF